MNATAMNHSPKEAESIQKLGLNQQLSQEPQRLANQGADFNVIGLNFKSTPLAIRSRLVFPVSELGPALQLLKELIEVEVALLSTCNRTEVYLYGSGHLVNKLYQLLAEKAGLPLEEIQKYCYVLSGFQAIEHTMRVASGMDSMILGEPQILGQIKLAAQQSIDAGTAGKNLQFFFQKIFATAKEIRHKTAIGEHSTNLARIATRLSEGLFESWGDTRVLLIGAGEMIELCARHFADKQPQSLVIANRSFERAESLMLEIRSRFAGVGIISLSDLPETLHNFDVVLSCTASILPIIGLGMVKKALRQRHRRPILMIDLAVPPDMEEAIRHLPDVFFYSIDDLAQQVQGNQQLRHQAIEIAEDIVQQRAEELRQIHLNREKLSPRIQKLQMLAQKWQEEELAKAQKLILKGADINETLTKLAHNLSAKFLHEAILSVRTSNEFSALPLPPESIAQETHA